MVKHDDYMTPFSAWEDVSAYIPRHLTLWEAFYGDGTSGHHLTELGFDVIHANYFFLRVFLFLLTALLVLLSRGCGGSLPREPLLLVLLIALLPRHLHVVKLRGHLGELLPEAADLGDPQLLLLVEPLLALCLLYTSPSPRDRQKSRMPSSA